MKKILILILSFFLILGSCNLVFANLGILGSKIIKVDNSTLNVQSYIVNREDLVKADINVYYDLKRVSDLSVFFEDKLQISFDKNEVKLIEKNISIKSIPNGEYFLDIIVKSGANLPLAQYKDLINISNNFDGEVYFTELPYLKVYYPYEDGKVRYELSYAQTGKPILPNSTFDVKFNLKVKNVNSGHMKFFLKNSYDRGDGEEIYSQDINFLNDNLNFSIPIKIEKSGTYNLFVKVYNDLNELVANKDVRVVIMGQGGTIIDVFNSQDIYSQGDKFNLDVQYVGPADAMSITKDCYLKLLIIKNGNIIEEKTKKISELDFNSAKVNFNFDINENLDFYKVKLILGKGNVIFDEVELNYEELNPELVISNDGRIYDPEVKACFTDGVCTEVEKSLGNCFDCESIKYTNSNDSQGNNISTIDKNNANNSENNNFKSINYFYLVIGGIIFIIILSLVFWRFKKNE